MSTIVKYSTGSTYTIVPNKVDIEKVQDLDGQYHIPNTSIVGMLRLGLGIQRITVSGDALDMSACLWHDVVAISFDSGTSYQTVYFAGVPYTSDCWSGIYPYALSLLASPLKEQTAVRYPTTGYKWGNQSITGISQAGNVNAFPIIHYLAPLFYAPLSNTLIDFAGNSVTFTRTAAKDHGGVTHPINTPIFDSGLYLASDTAQDVATWTPPAATVRTVAMQLKSRYPSPWVIGGSGGNFLTANDSNLETSVGNWASDGATVTRDTAAPLVGTGSLKMVSAGSCAYAKAAISGLVVGQWYAVQGLFKSVAAVHGAWVGIYGGGMNFIHGAAIDVSSAPAICTFVFCAAATTGFVIASLSGYAAGEILYGDSFMIEAIPLTLGIWSEGGTYHNDLHIDTVNNLLKWSDGTATVGLALPAAYLAGTIMDLVATHDAGSVITLAVHPVGGAWTSTTNNTLTSLSWGPMNLGRTLSYAGNLEGSIANLVQFPYVLTSAEYQALAYSSLSLLYNTLYIGNRYAGEIVKGSDKRLLNALGSDISALLGGTDIAIGASAVTIAQSQGLSARWYVEVKRTDV